MRNALAKIIAGSQAGAEFTLVPGTYVLGTGESADLLLTDAAVRPRHVAITVDADGWRVDPLEGAVTVNGNSVAGTSVLGPYDVLGLGGIFMAFGPDGEWDMLPEVPAPKIAPPIRNEEPTPDSEPGDTETPEALPERTPAARKPFPWKKLLAWVVALAVAAVAWWYLTLPPDPMKAKINQAVSGLAADGFAAHAPAPERLSPGSVGVGVTADGKVRLTGLVADRESRDGVLAAVGLPPGEVSSALETVEDGVEAANLAVATRFADLSVQAERSGFVARISGLADSVAEAGAAFRLAREHLNPAIPLRNGMLIWNEVRRDAEAAAGRLGLEGAWFERRGGDVILHCSPWPTTRQQRDLLDFLRTRYGEDALGDFITALSAAPLKPEPKPVFVVTPPPVLPELDPALRSWALQPLPAVRPPEPPAAVQPAPDAEPEPQSAPMIAAEPIHQPEPAPEPPPEPAPAPIPVPAPPPEPVLNIVLVKAVTDNGFFDQSGRYYQIGDFLAGEIRLAAVWNRGVVLQQGRETIFAPQGSEFILP